MKYSFLLFFLWASSAFAETISIPQVFTAVSSDNVIVLKKYLDQGGDPSALNEKGYSLLYVATGPHGGNNVLKLLLKSGANPNLGNSYGYTPLMNSSSWCDLNAVRILISYNADISRKNSRGQTARETVCAGGRNREAVIEFLKNIISH